MNGGWVKLPRRLLESHILRQPELLQVFIHAILQARFKESIVTVNKCTVALEPGQCIFGRSEWAFELHLSQTKVYRALRKLEEYGYIKVKATTKYSVITIVGWELYNETDLEQAFKQQLNSKRTAESFGISEKKENTEQQIAQQTNSKRTQKKKDNNLNNNIYNTAFEEFWEHYPNRFNRQQTHKNFVKAAKAHGAEAILKALDRYRAEIDAKGTAAEFIVRSTNFVGQKAYYLGYLEDEEPKQDVLPACDNTVARIAKEWGYDE